jgi:hypothetical protein
MTLYFIPPTLNLERIVEQLDNEGVSFNIIMSAMKPTCLETAMVIYNNIASQCLPLPTDLLNEQGNRNRPGLTELKQSFPELDFDGYSEICDVLSDNETQSSAYQRIESAIK